MPRGRAVDLDDRRPDQLVHPELVGVLERLGVDRRVRVALGAEAVVDLVERDEPAVLVRAGRRRRSASRHGRPAGARLEALEPVGAELRR